jgi:hypothetical protein
MDHDHYPDLKSVPPIMLQSQKIREVNFSQGNLFFSTTWHLQLGCVEMVCVMTNIVTLRPKERVQQNVEPIATIYRNLGTSSAEGVVTRALGELALAMSGLAEQVRSHQMSDLAQQFRRLGRMAENLGMVSLATVASDLTICLHRSDATAFAAVWARLLRIAECSLACETDLMDKTLV